jgi:type IV secretory pathway component VirB8
MSQALEESMRMYEEENRKAPPDESLAVSTALLFCILCMITIIIIIQLNSLSSS